MQMKIVRKYRIKAAKKCGMWKKFLNREFHMAK